MRRRSVLAGLAATIVGGGMPQGGRTHDVPPSGDAAPALGSEIFFELADPNGNMVRAADLRGRWLLVFFGYTFCPDLCPTTLSEIAGVLGRLGPLAARVQPVFVSIDPQRDTPQALRAYVGGFDQRILALSGTADQLAQAARSFGVAFYKIPGSASDEYTFAHSATMTLIGPEGGLVTRFSTDATADWMAAQLRTLIDGSSS
jgi:protein SCO1